MIACIILIGFGVKTEQPIDISQEVKIYQDTGSSTAFWAIFLACACPISFGVAGLVVRNLNTKLGIDPEEFSNDYFLIMGVFTIIACILAYTLDDYTFDLMEFLQVFLAGVMAGLGMIFLSMATTIGYAGVVYSLINVQVIIQTVLGAIFLGQIPNTLEIIAGCLGIIGS